MTLEGELKNLQALILLTISGTSSLNTLYNDDAAESKRRDYLLHKKYVRIYQYLLCYKISRYWIISLVTIL